MALWPSRRMRNPLDEMWRDIDWIERQMDPYIREDERHIIRAANENQVVNDEKKFAVEMDVSRFKPEELKVHIEGRDLTIEGKQEEKTDHGFIERAFVRKWSLPDDCDLDGVHTQLDDMGHLLIEAPKTGRHTNRRTLPIKTVPKK